MIIQLDSGEQVDTDGLSPEERHILQKLLCYKVIVCSVKEFRERTAKAFVDGWNDSGPVAEGEQLGKVIVQLELELQRRLAAE